ncbi:MAG: hypothetical protein ACTSWM_04465, partial [Alphaproteobacteria bacterium]
MKENMAYRCMKTLNERFNGKREGGGARGVFLHRPEIETAGPNILPRNVWGRRRKGNRVEPTRGRRLLLGIGLLSLAGCAGPVVPQGPAGAARSD